jgi:fumarate hydratase subunit beta
VSEAARLTTPLSDEQVAKLRAGDRVLISGRLLTARDAAHKRLFELAKAGQNLPVDLRGQVIYYVGPTPGKPGEVIGSAGPTTSGRVDAYTPALLALGLKGMIGKGSRSEEVRQAMVQHRAVYFAAVGGAGALLRKRIRKSEVVAYPELGTEAIRILEVEDFPTIVVNDIHGADLYEDGQKAYRRL